MTDTTTMPMAPIHVETDEQRIARLESELKASGRNNYLLQEAGTQVVWNNEHLRAAIRQAVLTLAEQQGLMVAKDLSGAAKALDEVIGLPGTMTSLVRATEKAS
jgi:hypothetical protein